MTITPTPEGTMTEQPAFTLADLRRAAGLTQKQVAQRMGIGQSRVGHIEKDYPNLHFKVVNSYVNALGGHLALTGIGGHTVPADDVRLDPRDPGAETNRRQRSPQGVEILRASAAKELPLQGDEPEPSGDDTSGQVDHPDTEGDESDGSQGQQA